MPEMPSTGSKPGTAFFMVVVVAVVIVSVVAVIFVEIPQRPSGATSAE